MTPETLQYSKEHEWLHIKKDGSALIGITPYAQEQLGDIVYISLPELGALVQQFGKLGEIESVKAVSDIYAPISGKVLRINHNIIEHPELVNEFPYESWLLELLPKDPSELHNLLTTEEYEAYLVQLT